jgi:Ca2+-binding EF-hand superfamily protein
MKHVTVISMLLTGLAGSSVALADHHESSGMQTEKLPSAFSKFDKNSDGRISRDEAREGSDRMFNDIDTNKDGFISKEEMQAHHKVMHDEFREGMREKLRDHCKSADKDGVGSLCRAEVEAAHMKRLSRDFDKLDTNKDGKLSEDEMKMTMRSGAK